MDKKESFLNSKKYISSKFQDKKAHRENTFHKFGLKIIVKCQLHPNVPVSVIENENFI